MTFSDEETKWLKVNGVEYYCTKENIQNSSIKIVQTTLSLNDTENQVALKPEIQNQTLSLSRKIANESENIEDLKASLLKYDECKLKQIANSTVFGEGVANAQIILIGEAPGANEDLAGIPFCGESGKLLNLMLQQIGISRTSNAFFTNTVFWRPPANRQPTVQEVEFCKPFVEKLIALIKPKLLILVGSTAATSLLGKEALITKIRRSYYHYSNQYLDNPINATAIFHPAYLLRQPFQKATWSDLLKIQEYLQQFKS